MPTEPAREPALFQTFWPRRFCREYVEIRQSSSQLLMFMSLVLGLKPLMDDWVPVSAFEDYRRMCQGYGIHLATDAVKLLISREVALQRAVGAESLTSTIALGLPPGAPLPPEPKGRLHVFLSREPERLRHGMWYPVVVKDRVVWPPYADVLAYGRHLGYPECCIRFFRARNDWNRYSFLAEIHRQSQGRPRYWLCNPLTKDRTYSYLYHMPCRWDCPATLALAGRLRAEVAAREPELVEQVDRHLRLPALVFYERKHYVFEGVLSGNRLDYQAVHYPDWDAGGQAYYQRLSQGDALELVGQAVRIYRGGRQVDEIVARSEGFAPEHPFLVQFDRDPPG